MKTTTKVILGLLAGTAGLSALVVGLDASRDNVIEEKLNLPVGQAQEGCHDCKEGAYTCNKREDTKTVMLGANCGASAMSGEDPELTRLVKETCSNAIGTMLSTLKSDVETYESLKKERRACVPIERYRCRKTSETLADGKYIYVWKEDREAPGDAGYPTCGVRVYCEPWRKK